MFLCQPRLPNILHDDAIRYTIDAIIEAGIESSRVSSSEDVSDPKDVVFYEVAMSREDSYLVTGNIKHFPADRRVVTPNEMLEILKCLETDK